MRRSQDGHRNSLAVGLRIRPSLMMAVDAPAPPVKRELHKYNGKQRVRPSRSDTPDNVILEVRRLHEQCGLSIKKIVDELASHGIDKTEMWVRSCINYHQRGHLVPAEKSTTYLKD